jgi:4-amino-4-deoxy-L-arabinose transferase-like glycosyltransferase
VASVRPRGRPASGTAATVLAGAVRDHRDVLVVSLLTAIAFALRVRGFGEGLWNDELLTLDETRGRSLLGVVDVVANGVDGEPLEKNPPFFFVLAWAGTKLGDPLSWIRLPSVALGTATVPLVFLLGRRTVGRTAALAGAGFVALSPFAVYYGIEARSYATLMFLGVLSALVLRSAVETGRPRWWAAYAATVAAVVYTHYTGVAVIAAEGAWALWYWRARWRGLLAAYAGAAAAFAPWIPYVQPSPDHFGGMARLLRVDHWDAFLQWLAGSPEARPSELPGTLAFVLIGCALAVALAGRLLAPRRRAPAPARGPALILALACAGPVFCLIYGVVSDDLFLFPRNMSASVPFAGLALGWALTRPRAPWAAAAVGLAAAGLGVAAARTLDGAAHRPDVPGVARLLDERAGPADLVLFHGGGFDPFLVARSTALYFERRHARAGADMREASVMRAFDAHRGLGRVFVVELESPARPQPPSVPGWEAVYHRRLPGLRTMTVVAYREL